MSVSGINAYIANIAIKHVYFKTLKMPSKQFGRKYIKKWNESVRHRDGIFYYKINEKYPDIKVLKLLFAIYYLENSNYYVLNIIEDEFKLFDWYIRELKNIEDEFVTQTTGILLDCKKKRIKFKDLLVSKKGIPKIFKMNLSYNILVTYNRIFDIIGLNKENKLNVLEKEIWDDVKNKLIGYDRLISRHIDYDWKKLFVNCLKGVQK